MMHGVAQHSGVETDRPPARPGLHPGSGARVRRAARRGLWNDARGLSTVEYVIILVLIAAVAIGAWKAFGKQVQCAIARTDREMPRFRDGELEDVAGGSPCPNVGDGAGSGSGSGEGTGTRGGGGP